MKPSSPPRGANRTSPAIAELASRRQELESRFVELRRALDRELGWSPATRTWMLPLAAFASGLALAAWLVARRRK